MKCFIKQLFDMFIYDEKWNLKSSATRPFSLLFLFGESPFQYGLWPDFCEFFACCFWLSVYENRLVLHAGVRKEASGLRLALIHTICPGTSSQRPHLFPKHTFSITQVCNGASLELNGYIKKKKKKKQDWTLVNILNWYSI